MGWARSVSATRTVKNESGGTDPYQLVMKNESGLLSVVKVAFWLANNQQCVENVGKIYA